MKGKDYIAWLHRNNRTQENREYRHLKQKLLILMSRYKDKMFYYAKLKNEAITRARQLGLHHNSIYGHVNNNVYAKMVNYYGNKEDYYRDNYYRARSKMSNYRFIT